VSVLTVAGAARYDLRDVVLDLLRVVDMLRPAAVLGQSFGGLVHPFATPELTHVNHSCFTTPPMGGVLTGPVLLATTAGCTARGPSTASSVCSPSGLGGYSAGEVRTFGREVSWPSPRSGSDDRP
jgi:hypothetical protein